MESTLCNQSGSGRVYVPFGIFVTGTFHLKSNVDLFMEGDAVIQGRPNFKDHESNTKTGCG